MMSQGEACERKRQLLQDLLQVLSRVSQVTRNQVAMTNQDAAYEQSELNATLQRAVDEQRQALRELEDHQQEHGC